MNDTDSTVWQITGDIRRRYDKLLKHTTSITKATQKELYRIDKDWQKKLEALVVMARTLSGIDAGLRQFCNSSDICVYLGITDINNVTKRVRPRAIELKDVILATKLTFVIDHKSGVCNLGQLKISNDGYLRFRGDRFNNARLAIASIRQQLKDDGTVDHLLSAVE